MGRFPIALGLTALALLFFGAHYPGLAADQETKQKVVVHLSHYTDDLHAVSMAIALATNLQQGGAIVTLFLDLEGVRLGDSRVPQDLRWGSGGPVSERYDEFVNAGGSVLLCAHCSEAAGIDSTHVRRGASIGSDSQVRILYMEADKVIDY